MWSRVRCLFRLPRAIQSKQQLSCSNGRTQSKGDGVVVRYQWATCSPFSIIFAPAELCGSLSEHELLYQRALAQPRSQQRALRIREGNAKQEGLIHQQCRAVSNHPNPGVICGILSLQKKQDGSEKWKRHLVMSKQEKESGVQDSGTLIHLKVPSVINEGTGQPFPSKFCQGQLSHCRNCCTEKTV